MKKLTIFLAFLLFAGFNAVAQMQIAGTVTSAEDGLPIPGVSVVVKGNSSIGISTDIDGKYTLTVPKSAVSLVFTSVGMKTVEEDINNRTIVDVKMKPDILGIDEVMVVAYGTAKKASFTGAAKTVSSEELSSVKVESIDKALAGKVSGVRVSSKTGAPGSSGDIQIRGIGSITGSTSPLYIVDGVAITTGNFGHSAASSNVLSSINPEDIESTTVLKDAAAASLYGSRAANGVVIITTKKGKSGEAKFNFKANYGISGIATNSFQHMGGIAYYDYMHKALENFYYFNENALFTDKTPALEKAAKNYADENIWVKRQNGANWRDEIYGQGTDKDYQLSVSGGGENNQYYISAGYKDIKGIVLNTDFKRYSSIINVNSKPRKWLDLSAGAQLAHTEQNGVRDQATLMQQGLGSSSPLSLIFQSRPGQNVHNEDGTYNQKAGFGKIKNAVEKLKDGDQFVNTKSNRALINASGTIKFTDGLKFTSTNSAEYIGNETLEYWGPNSIGGSAMNGYGQRNQRRVITLTSSNILNYTKTFNEDHNISALAGFEVQDFEYLKVYTGVTDYSSPKLMELSAGKPHRAMSEIINDYLQSFLGNLDYNYANRYYLKASIRQDQSSKLGVDNRKGIFWSASASWRLTEEDFIDISFLNDAKVRFSYGTNGNLPNYSYSHLGLYDLSSVYGPFSATYLSQLGNKNLGWEKSNNMNVGLDISIFDKISFTVEYFHKRTKDLLLDMPVSYATGVSEIISNAGEISNKGIDMELHLVDILSSELKWNADLAFSTLTAKVEKLPGGEDIVLGDGNFYLYSEGMDLYTFYLPTWNGVNRETGFSEFLIDPTKPATPDNLTMNHSEAKRGPAGKAYPDFTGGMTNEFSYKGITLHTLITFQFGGNLFDYPGYFFHHDGTRFGFNLGKDVEDNYWTPDNKDADNPQPVYKWAYRPDRWSTKHILSTDFVRLKEVGLSYTLPGTFTKKYGINNLKVNFSITNAAYLYAATKDMELEVNLNGYRTNDTPLSRTYSFGVSFNF